MTGAGLLALVLATGLVDPAFAQQQPATTPAPVAAPAGPQPMKLDRETLLVLVRSTLIALDHANKTGNYSVLRDLGAPEFQRDNTLVKLGEIFAGQRQAGLDLGGALILEPTVTLQPQFEKNRLLHLAGYFPINSDGRLNFELYYQFVDKKLLLYRLKVNFAQPGALPAAAAPAVAAQVPAATPAPAAAAKPAPAKPKPKPKPTPKPVPKPKPAPDAAPAQ